MASGRPIPVKTLERDRALEKIQERMLWLATQMVHHANRVRENSDDLKVGGHQASSASVATIMTALYFDFMRAGERDQRDGAWPALQALPGTGAGGS